MLPDFLLDLIEMSEFPFVTCRLAGSSSKFGITNLIRLKRLIFFSSTMTKDKNLLVFSLPSLRRRAFFYFNHTDVCWRQVGCNQVSHPLSFFLGQHIGLTAGSGHKLHSNLVRTKREIFDGDKNYLSILEQFLGMDIFPGSIELWMAVIQWYEHGYFASELHHADFLAEWLT